ncbi:MAG: enoyl-CoA hydratase-related protein, partial [Betaproteobacteria bacterium]
MSYEFITVEVKGRVALITLNRPKQLNALAPKLMQELGAALYGYDADDGVGAIVITGNEKAFAAGADIGAMKDFDFQHAFKSNYITRDWEHIRNVRKPVIAAVAGYALGGGCELAMMCDIVIAAD